MKQFKPLIAVIAVLGTGNLAAQNFENLPLNEIKVKGWMFNQMDRDLRHGYISRYKEMQPSMHLDAFGPEKTTNYETDDLGNWISRMATWWPGEHEGYYADDVIRMAYLTGNEEWMEKARKIVLHVLENQTKEGYIGIYKAHCRLDKLINDNGELWSQSRMLGALLAYYEFTGDRKCYTAVKKAIDYTIDCYVRSGKSYFNQPSPSGGGITHGLMYVDILEWMYRYTGDRKYADFARWLYHDYSTAGNLKQTDHQLKNLLDRRRLFMEHSVHVVEHMRVLLWLDMMFEESDYHDAVRNMFFKYKASRSPGGVVVMDPVIHESVAGNYGTPDLPYEYCAIVETVSSFASALQKYGCRDFGDDIERVVFNAGQGARLADGTAISYATKDNRLDAKEADGFRYQVAACHKVACCNLQAPKLIPYYSANMWMKKKGESALYAMLYGPSQVNTTLDGKKISILEDTMYPFENNLVFKISVQGVQEFKLGFREPAWSGQTIVETTVKNASVKKENGFIVVSGKWSDGDEVRLTLDENVRVERCLNNEFCFVRGALLYAADIPYRKVATKEFKEGFANYDVLPQSRQEAEMIFSHLRVDDNIDIRCMKGTAEFHYEENPDADHVYPYDKPYGYIKGIFYIDGKQHEYRLTPMGSSVLRRVSFKEKSR